MTYLKYLLAQAVEMHCACQIHIPCQKALLMQTHLLADLYKLNHNLAPECLRFLYLGSLLAEHA